MAEVLGAFGLVLPGLLRIRQGLTPLAAAGLVIIMIGATVVMWAGGMVAVALMNVIVALLAAFVAYGRWRLAPYRDLSRRRCSGPQAEYEAAFSEGTDDEHRRILQGAARSDARRDGFLLRTDCRIDPGRDARWDRSERDRINAVVVELALVGTARLAMTNRNEPRRPDSSDLQLQVIIGRCWFVLVVVVTGFPLITQRSLVQIQPPQP